MSNNQNETAYSTRTLSKWFAISSILLLFVTLWAAVQDYERPWKAYQRQAQKVSTALNERKLLVATEQMDKSKLEGIETELAAIDEELEDLVEEIDEKIAAEDAVLYIATKEYQIAKGIHDENHYRLEEAIRIKSPSYEKMLAAYNKEKTKVAILFKRQEAAMVAKEKALADKKDILKKQSDLSDRKSSLERSRDGLKKAITQTELSIVNIVRNAPIIDLVAPTVKINQVILHGLYDEYFFNKVPRVDRCMTCHVNANQAGFEDFPQPFTTHSKLHLVSGPDSPHPVEKFGCTVCHAGVPQSVDFMNSAHTPRDEKQAAEWQAKYHFHRNHHIKTHMIPLKMTEGKCIQCHAKEVVVDEAPTLNAGLRIIERVGCYGCHKFAGHFDELHAEKKAGPSLTRVASKVQPDWIKKWLWNPKSYRPSTLMPAFWQTHNNSDPDSIERGKVEVEAITHYLVKKSEKYEPLQLASTVVGDVTKGKTLVKEIGCLGCHADASFPADRSDDPKELGYKDPRIPMFGPELNQMGSKVSEDWLKSWLKQPKHYWAGTSMPSMKLSDQEVSHISAYLLSKKNLEFEMLATPKGDDKVRDSVILEFLQGQMHTDTAKVKLASMSLEDKQDYLGQKMISTYGCYACHAIAGFEDAPRIGAELTIQGSKEVTKFSFENVEIDHTSREQWIYTKIRTPRIWDVGKKRAFASKTLMPHFGLTHEQANAVASVVIGYEAQNVAEARKAPVDGRLEDIIAGQRVINRYNCIGCHALQKEGSEYGGDILAHFDDPGEGPPLLYTQGAKTQSDWLFAYLKNTDLMIRPWLKVRMPTFNMTDEEARAITKYFAAFDDAPYPFNSSHANKLSSEEVSQAAALVDELGCMSCHAVLPEGEDPSGAAPIFKNVKARLNGEWVVDWLRNPNKIMPGTRMPALWTSDDPDDPNSPILGIPGYFGDDAETQMRKVRDYLFQYGGKAQLPPKPASVPSQVPSQASE